MRLKYSLFSTTVYYRLNATQWPMYPRMYRAYRLLGEYCTRRTARDSSSTPCDCVRVVAPCCVCKQPRGSTRTGYIVLYTDQGAQAPHPRQVQGRNTAPRRRPGRMATVCLEAERVRVCAVYVPCMCRVCAVCVHDRSECLPRLASKP
jgi:hypothetical protein